MNTKESLQKVIAGKYQDSRDFNGFAIRDFSSDDNLSDDELREIISALIEEGVIEINFDINPYIKRLPLLSPEEQISRLEETDINQIVAFPSATYLQKIVNPTVYEGKPFTLRLALGEPQLTFVTFDLRVLEYYRNDPRFYYKYNDINGRISYTQDNEPMLAERDRVFLESFGTAYNSEGHRAVGVFLRYLSKFNSEHQQIWQTHLLDQDYKMHPDYFRSTIIGDWHQGVTVLTAFLEELRQVNNLCKLINYPPLFRKEFNDDQRPQAFSFLIRPTLKEFNSFIQLLDKMLSDNFNKDFFKKDLELEREEVRNDGKVIVTQKGTLSLLDEWLELKFRPANAESVEEIRKITKGFKKVRNLRNKPAHKVNEDVFDQAYFLEQQKLMVEVYESILILRRLLQLHPKCKDYKVPNWLESGEIYTQ